MSPARSHAPRLKVYKTKLIVGEGSNEKSFLDHIRSLYHTRMLGFDITIRNSTGGDPNSVLDNAIRRKKSIAYDEVYVLLDTDLEWSRSLINKADTNKITLIGASPICLEGLLLRIKDISLPPNLTSQACKSKLNSELSGKPFSQSFFNNHYNRQALDLASQQIECLRQIINIFSVL